MVVLDVTTWTFEEFIQTKAREEDKIRVFRDAGYDMDLGGKDITSVQYQNANNSVRVSDEFMRPSRNGTFGLAARRTGEIIASVGAKDLFRKMAKAAWMRRPRHSVRRHHQRLAHLPGVGPDHCQQPLLSRLTSGW